MRWGRSVGSKRFSVFAPAANLFGRRRRQRGMHNLLFRYETKPEATERNAELVGNVFRELEAAAPEGVRYLVLCGAENTFYHFVAYESEEANDQLTELPAFKAFVEGGEARRVAKPAGGDITIVGNYGMLAT